MRSRNFKGRCEKRSFSKSTTVCRLYSPLMAAFAEKLQTDDTVIAFECIVPMEGTELTSDFLITSEGGAKAIRECVPREKLESAIVIKNLDMSLSYWRRHGISDWKTVTECK